MHCRTKSALSSLPRKPGVPAVESEKLRRRQPTLDSVIRRNTTNKKEKVPIFKPVCIRISVTWYRFLARQV
jgi:hypothetical protein